MIYFALKMLIWDRGKFLGILLGVSFSTLIMTQQPGIFVGLMNRTFSFVTDTALPDLWIMDPMVKFADDSKPMMSTMLYRVRSVSGIEWAEPMYNGQLSVTLADGNFQTCMIIGVDDATMIGGPARMIQGKLSDLRQEDSIIVSQEGAQDKLAHPSRTPGGPKIPLAIGDMITINDRRAKVVGIAETSRNFQSLPSIFTTYARALNFAPPRRQMMSFVVAKAKPGVPIQQLKERIKEQTGMGVYTGKEFKDLTFDYYMKNTGIPVNFGFSVLMGFLVGAVIAAQTFYNFTRENLKYFGVMKAMGIKTFRLARMILFQASLVGFLGYGLGLGGTYLFWCSAGQNGTLAFQFPWELLAFSSGGVFVIILLAGLLSLYKLIKLEPAEVFQK